MRFANTHFASMGGIVFGRTVYEGFVEYWDRLVPTDPGTPDLEREFAGIFRGIERIVVSTTLETDGSEGTTVIADDLAGALTRLKERPGNDLLLICGPALRSTLAGLGLIDRFRTLVAPVALGEGVPLFAPVTEPVGLRLVASTQFSGGVAMLDHERA
jgi:dihydrofolate reductase